MSRFFVFLFFCVFCVVCHQSSVNDIEIKKTDNVLHPKHKEVRDKIINSEYFSKAEKLQLSHHLDEMYNPHKDKKSTKK